MQGLELAIDYKYAIVSNYEMHIIQPKSRVRKQTGLLRYSDIVNRGANETFLILSTVTQHLTLSQYNCVLYFFNF